MNREQYTKATAVYPELGTGSPLALAYCALGLAGEAGELARAVEDDTDTIVSEMGDVSWYSARLGSELDISVSASADNPDEPWPHRSIVDLSTQVAEQVKKLVRDGLSNKKRIATIRGLLSDIEVRLTQLARSCGLTLDEVRDLSIVKLTNRKTNNTIHGDGDRR